MAKKLKIWYDKEGDYLEVLLSDVPGYMRETDNNCVMERVDESGNIIGYSFIGISNMNNINPIYTEIELA